MRPRILILGGGTGGTLAANRLRKRCGETAQITVIDRDDRHVYQPGLLFVPFGLADPAKLVRPRRAQLHDGIEFRLAEVERIETADNTVLLSHGETVPYDVLVIASGASLLSGETEGLTGEGWRERMSTFYTLEGATALRDALRAFDHGRLVVNMVDLPVKCPVAPLEFCFLADWHFKQRGIRDRIQIEYVTSLDGAFTKATCNRELSGLLSGKGIDVITEFNTGEVDGAGGRLISWDDREVPFDLLVAIPLHGGAEFVGRSTGLGDELGFVLVDRGTLQATAASNVFAIGDATNVPTSKAGSVAHFEGETLVANIIRYLEGRELKPTFDGHTNCFIETGFHKALLIDFNYETEPLPGWFPEPRLGPLPLLRESRLNHIGKLAFEWIYWHVLLPGRPIPGISAQMRPGGKRLVAATMERSIR
ncbi:MAG TPA: FAD/NAD(P)-binding oxidoreductase [Solirubrobacteraceae bacterium]|nr:FAD/NAD(P)-binding oxidoreductase [Solirubrobacteraceae bacterium]